MGFEGQQPIENPKLRAALAALGKAIDENFSPSLERKEFDSSTGFHIRVEFHDEGRRTLHITQSGTTAYFALNKTGVVFIKLVDLDDQHLDDKRMQEKLTAEAHRLVASDELTIN